MSDRRSVGSCRYEAARMGYRKAVVNNLGCGLGTEMLYVKTYMTEINLHETASRFQHYQHSMMAKV